MAQLERAPVCEAGEMGANPIHLTTFARGDEGVESALCRREVSRCESDHERHFGRVVQQSGPLSYTEEITVRIRAWPFNAHRGRTARFEQNRIRAVLRFAKKNTHRRPSRADCVGMVWAPAGFDADVG